MRPGICFFDVHRKVLRTETGDVCVHCGHSATELKGYVYLSPDDLKPSHRKRLASFQELHSAA